MPNNDTAGDAATAAETGKPYQAGTYQATVKGHNGDLTVVLQNTIDQFNESSITLNDAEFGRNAFAANILLTDHG